MSLSLIASFLNIKEIILNCENNLKCDFITLLSNSQMISNDIDIPDHESTTQSWENHFPFHFLLTIVNLANS